jgi:hypothetical protein
LANWFTDHNQLTVSSLADIHIYSVTERAQAVERESQREKGGGDNAQIYSLVLAGTLRRPCCCDTILTVVRARVCVYACACMCGAKAEKYVVKIRRIRVWDRMRTRTTAGMLRPHAVTRPSAGLMVTTAHWRWRAGAVEGADVEPLFVVGTVYTTLVCLFLVLPSPSALSHPQQPLRDVIVATDALGGTSTENLQKTGVIER